MSEQETPKAAAAFREYCLMGADRSLAKLAHKLGRPAGYIRQLEYWSSQHDWVKRAASYDEEQSRQLEATIAAEKARVLKSGYALMHKRIELLARKVEQLKDITDNEDTIWIPDVKSVGTGPTAERVDLVQFNDAAFRELREYLTDIADEMGERVKTTKQQVSVTLPKEYVNVPEDGTDE